MSLTQEQRVVLKAYIDSSPELAAAAQIGSVGTIERALNELSTEIVWKTSVETSDIGRVVNYIAVESMTDINRAKIGNFYTMNPQKFVPTVDVRSYWNSAFAGALGGQGAATRAALDALWRRVATVAESLLSVGTGTEVAPATLSWEGTVSAFDVEQILAGV